MSLRSRTPRVLVAATLAVIAALARPPAAVADKPKLHLQRVDVRKYPIINTYLSLVEGDGRVVTGKTRDDFKLVFDSNEQGTAAEAKAYDQLAEPIFIVIVAQVTQAMHDVIDYEKQGIKQIAQAVAGLKGSKVGIITYAQEQKRVAEMVKPEEVDGLAAAIAEDTEGAESHLLDALRTAIDFLNAKGIPDEGRKVIVVFSDGIDVSGSDKKTFTELGKRANLAGIVINTIGFAPFDQSKLKNLFELSKQTAGTDRLCKTPQDVSAQWSNMADEVTKQMLVVFRSIVVGGAKDHVIQVLYESAGAQAYSETVSKICEDHVEKAPAESIFKKWWFWVFCVALPLIFLVLLVLWLLGRRGTEEVVAQPQPAQVASSPQRTIAIDLNVGAKGPTIGWIVGLTGKYNERTFKLKPQVTVIGTATDADIQLEDGKVSRRHCEIRFDGHTYKIVDLGSTNGVILNDKRTASAELIDGDSFRLGSTDFKFKSIN